MSGGSARQYPGAKLVTRTAEGSGAMMGARAINAVLGGWLFGLRRSLRPRRQPVSR